MAEPAVRANAESPQPWRPWLRAAGFVALAVVLTLGFLAYLRPAFMVDLTNMVLAWCG